MCVLYEIGPLTSCGGMRPGRLPLSGGRGPGARGQGPGARGQGPRARGQRAPTPPRVKMTRKITARTAKKTSTTIVYVRSPPHAVHRALSPPPMKLDVHMAPKGGQLG